uniref:Lycotoxin-Pa4a n=1 Tax=Pardosa astrigera TaxID=317848 RepID=TX4A_PARAW|nr:RecName: Full=Lycotoxin-Pa4a; Short=LCTX-Pa4a; Flags: Precursor [Pardosa astrigera]
MKLGIFFSVFFLAMIHSCLSETNEDKNLESYFREDDLKALSFGEYARAMMAESRKDNCIPKHHECTSRPKDCCKQNLMQFKCSCMTIIDKNNKETERCKCDNSIFQKVAKTSVNIGKAVVTK